MQHLLDRYVKDGYEYEITRAAVIRDTGALRLNISLNFVIPFKELDSIKAGVREMIPDVSAVELVFKYSEMVQPREDVIGGYMDYMIFCAERKNGAFAKAIRKKHVSEENGRLKVGALGQRMADMLNKTAAGSFSNMLRSAFGYDLDVVFENDEEEYEKTLSDVKETMKKPPERSYSPAAPGGASGKKGGAPTGDRIMGKLFDDPAEPMRTAREADTRVTVAGEIFKLETRDIKNSKKIVKFMFSDGTTSMCAKFFIKDENWGRISDVMKEGVYVKARGKLEWDSFDNALVLMAKDIRKTEKAVREDVAESKRVELHAHTKMSAMDGLNDAEALVKQAIAWGQPAVAITDHGVVQSFPTAHHAAGDKIKIIYGMEGYVLDDSDCIDENGNIDYKKKGTNHIILIVKNLTGLKNLYKMVSLSHLKYFYRRPRLPKSVIEEHREGLIIGSACEAGEVFRAVTSGQDEETVEKIAAFYDYLEIQPVANNMFMIGKGMARDEEQLKDFNRAIVSLGKRMGKPVVATTDAHYASPEEAIYRNILMAGQGYADDGGGQGLYLRTTDEMLEEFDYLDEDTARKVVIENTNMIADMCEDIAPVPDGKFPPKIQDSEKILKETCEKNAAEKYGTPLPDPIRERLDKELDSIIGNGYAVMYVAAKMLVEKSMSDGYLVGSRGSVGSSFAATMAGITEVNPLAPHYICPKCKHLEWGDEQEYDCGVDMPEKVCPECGTKMDQDGFAIPFETFLGFYGDKEPDIDLNFAGEYQGKAHRYVDEIFGGENVFKAGTIGTIASKTAFGYVMKYYDEKGLPVNKYEVDRLTTKCTGVKRTTGQHPGGIIIVPRGHEIFEFCPVQHPANDTKTDIITTHFDYHSIDQNLLKLDILGHDVPSMIKHLQDMTGLDPLKVPLKDPKVTGIFNGIEGLDIKDPDYKYTHGSYGIPEFGTKFVRQMLDDTHPDRFADLVRISGFSHGTDVWLNNAQEFIRSGQATMKEAISTRDDIMNYLILKGLPKGEAFQIMEKVRKGKGVTEERVALMKENDVPDWYIESCRRIKYMFPRAHAVAYVMMSYRIAYYKVYYPAEFYAVYLTTKIADFNWDVIQKGAKACLDRIDVIDMKGKEATAKEKDEVTVLEICYEMFSRGYDFMEPSLEGSKAMNFTVKDGRVVVPLCGLSGVGETVGRAIEREQAVRAFATIEDMQTRAKVNKTAVESLKNAGVISDMPESDQMCLF